jgi:hypothetical protein
MNVVGLVRLLMVAPKGAEIVPAGLEAAPAVDEIGATR